MLRKIIVVFFISSLTILFTSMYSFAENDNQNVDTVHTIDINDKGSYKFVKNSDNEIVKYQEILEKIDDISKTYVQSSTIELNEPQKLKETLFKDEDSSVIEELNLRNEYINELNYKDQLINFKAEILIDKINNNGEVISITIKRNIDKYVNIESEELNVDESSYETYIFRRNNSKNWILEKVFFDITGSKSKEMLEIESSENINNFSRKEHSYLYSKEDISELKSLNNGVDLKQISEDQEVVANISALQERLTENSIMATRLNTHWKNYSKADALSYALNYWSNYNPNYVNCNPIGGDCTNFVSQAIHNAGLEMNSSWYHWNKSNYSASWIHTDHLRNYLIDNGIATGHWKYPPKYPNGIGLNGTVIQGMNSAGYWIHSAIIRSGSHVGNIYVVQHTGNYSNRKWPYSTIQTRFFRIY